MKSILETAIYVQDLEKSFSFYSGLFGFPLIFSEGERLRALDVAGRQVLLLFRAGVSTEPPLTGQRAIPPHDARGNQHLAFAIDADQLQAWRDRLRDYEVMIESEVNCGGHSVYFRDPDGHLLELITPGCWPIY